MTNHGRVAAPWNGSEMRLGWPTGCWEQNLLGTVSVLIWSLSPEQLKNQIWPLGDKCTPTEVRASPVASQALWFTMSTCTASCSRMPSNIQQHTFWPCPNASQVNSMQWCSQCRAAVRCAAAGPRNEKTHNQKPHFVFERMYKKLPKTKVIT